MFSKTAQLTIALDHMTVGVDDGKDRFMPVAPTKLFYSTFSNLRSTVLLLPRTRLSQLENHRWNGLFKGK